MSVLSTRNLQETFIAKSISRTGSVQITDPNATGYIADGEVVVLNSSGAVATTSNAATIGTSPTIQIVQRSGNDLIYSSKINGLNVKQYKGASAGSTSTDLEQVYEIGYTGSTGSIDVSLGLDYLVTLEFKHDDMMWSEQKQKYTLYAPYTATTQKAVAKELAKQGAFAYNKNAIPTTVVALNSGTADAFTVASGILTCAVTHGSNVITFNLAVTNSGFGAGSLVRLGCTGSGRGTVIPVYLVKEAHPTISNAYILECPYVGPTNAALPLADMGYVSTEGTNWGVRITGKSLTFVKDFFKFKKVAYTVGLAGFGSTAVNKRQDSKIAQGDGRIVAEEESFTKGFQGALNRMTIPLPATQFDAVSATTTALNTTLGDSFTYATTYYDVITIEHFSQNPQLTTSSAPMPQVIKIFSVDGASQTTAATNGTVTVLNTWMPTCPATFDTLSL